MYRYVVLLLSFAGVLTAAPVPFPVRWGKKGPRIDGWNKPVDVVGDCTFDRKDDKLTITVPGKGHGIYLQKRHPHLLRQVGGDFTVRVRVDGNFGEESNGRPLGHRGAGLCVTDGHWFVTATRIVGRNQGPRRWIMVMFQGEEGGEKADWVLPKAPRRAAGPQKMTAIETSLLPTKYIEVQRRGNRLKVATSEDGKAWIILDRELELRLPKTLKVGVTAEATIDGEFKAVFDQFKLTPAKK